MNTLSSEEQARVIAALVDGCSLRTTERLTGVWRQAIVALLRRVGAGCFRLHDTLMRDLDCSILELDECWAYVHTKEGHLKDGDEETWGDQYTYFAVDATRKIIPAFLTGKRVAPNFDAFAADLRARVLGAPQLSTDGHRAYIPAIEAAFGSRVHYGQCIKEYWADESSGASRDDVRYSRRRVRSCTKIPVQGHPDLDTVNTSYVERNNLDFRMSTRRLTRLTNGFSKQLDCLQAAVALYVCHRNFCKVHMTLRVPPALEAGITDHAWDIGELVDRALSAPEAPPLLPPEAPTAPPSPKRPPRAPSPGPVRVLPGQLALPGVA